MASQSRDENEIDVRKLLCKDLLNNKGETISMDSLFQEGKHVALYFSAHWCPPCRSFTPTLAKFYNKFSASKNLEIIFVSSDRDENAYKEYFSEMPWLTVPYEGGSKPTKNKLSQTFGVKGIPTLLLFDGADGSLITKNGRVELGKDIEGTDFPWRPMAFQQIFEGELVGKNGALVSFAEATKDKVLGLYFSAHWCPPCKQFTPSLMKTYEELKNAGKNFEVVFVTSDESEDAFQSYFDTMPWLAVPFQHTKKREALTAHFEIQSIPCLVILDEERDIITKHGRGAVAQDAKGEKFPWHEEALAPLNDSTTTFINDTPTLIYMTEGKPQDVQKAKEVVQEVATRVRQEVRAAKKAKKTGIRDLVFLYEDEEKEMSGKGESESVVLGDSIRQFLGLEDGKPRLVLLDVLNKSKFVEEENLSKERVEEIVELYKSGQLQFVGLGQR